MEAKWNIFYESFVNKGGYNDFLKGLLATAEIAVFGLIIGIVIGTILAIIEVFPKYKPLPKILDGIAKIYVGFFRGTPIVVQLLIGYFILLPLLNIRANGVVVAIVIFGLNSGAYVSEIMRGGIQSVDIGQLEAARALGLPYGSSMLKIVIPQAMKNTLPTLGNEFITLIKETSVVSFIAVVDVTRAFKSIADANYEYILPYLMLALTYLILVAIITVAIRLIEKRLKKSDRSR